jgi:plastocyanin
LRKLLVPALVAGLLGPAVAPALAATKRVVVGDNYFVRERGVPTVTVSKGTRVKWVWRGDGVHNVKVARGPVTFGSGTMARGRYVKRMTRTGTYTLICTVHGPADQRMTLVVR